MANEWCDDWGLEAELKLMVMVLLEKFKIEMRTKIFLYHDYKKGWRATVSDLDRVYIITSRGKSIMIEVQPYQGFWRSGALKFKKE